MNAINRQEADNICGITNVLFADVNDVVYLPDPVNHIMAESLILLRDEVDFNELYGSPESISFTCVSDKSKAGNVFNYNLFLKYPRQTADVVNTLEDMCHKPVIIILVDGNGVRQILGNIKNPMRLQLSPLKPGEATGYNGYELNFSGKYTHTPYVLV